MAQRYTHRVAGSAVESATPEANPHQNPHPDDRRRYDRQALRFGVTRTVRDACARICRVKTIVSSRYLGCLLVGCGALAAGSVSGPAAAAEEWLSLGSKDWAPTVITKSGIGTANATAEAKVTRKEIEGWCANWSPGDKGCVARELARPEAQTKYRASADCTRGRITAVDGQSYALAGVWDASDIGAGRTRWRDASGKIVGRDNASGGLAIAQQWEVLCPGIRTVTAQGGGTARPAPASPAAAPFKVGQTIEARYGREWVRGKIAQVRQVAGPAGAAFEYDVRLDNGKRGIVPANMVRNVGQ